MSVQRECDVCAHPFDAKTARAKYCGATCRSRKNRGAVPAANLPFAGSGVPSDDQGSDEPRLVKAVRTALESAGRLESFAGQQAMHLAEQMSSNKVAIGVAALNKELTATMDRALANTTKADDPVDEVKARRDAKRLAG